MTAAWTAKKPRRCRTWLKNFDQIDADKNGTVIPGRDLCLRQEACCQADAGKGQGKLFKRRTRTTTERSTGKRPRSCRTHLDNFDQIDADKDGTVSEDEIQAYAKVTTPRTKTDAQNDLIVFGRLTGARPCSERPLLPGSFSADMNQQVSSADNSSDDANGKLYSRPLRTKWMSPGSRPKPIRRSNGVSHPISDKREHRTR